MARKKRRKELSVRKIKEVLRLYMNCGMGPREISRSLSISPATASNYINGAKEANLSYSRIHAFEYFNGVTRITVPDNIRTGISKACRYGVLPVGVREKV